LESMPNGGNLSVSIQTDDKWLKVSFKDTGDGIPEEKIPDIFKSFFTTKASGTGLGLAISARIVRAHYGEITVESSSVETHRHKDTKSEMDEGQGTTFIVKLPLKDIRMS
ncbi:MAG: HAMP domain-containing sensor histidine kinase, partial [Candidatus Desantisbacteria bacterium]